LKNILFYFGHPSQYHFLKYTIKELRNKGYSILIVIKTKDILEELLLNDKEEYYNILPEGRKQTKVQILIGLIKRDFRLFKFVFNKGIDLFIGTDPSLSHVGWILGIPIITVLEDDIEVVSSLANLTFPFTSVIVTPQIVRVGRYSKKKIGYEGYMKLAYLHPTYFVAKELPIDKPYSLIRLSGLNAYHDFGIGGIDDSLLEIIITRLALVGEVYISSEVPLKSKFKKYLLKINHSEFHQYLASAKILISDSQSMSMEAAMLGIPSIRYSDFTGRISVLEELEHKYQLTFGIRTSNPNLLLAKIDELIGEKNIVELFQSRRNQMLSEKIDVSAFMTWLITEYPRSASIMKINPDYQYNFR
jgi:uncharacterized protein